MATNICSQPLCEGWEERGPNRGHPRGGSGKGAAPRATNPCRRRAGAEPRGRTWNTSGRTDTEMVGRRGRAGTDARARSGDGTARSAVAAPSRSSTGSLSDMALELGIRQLNGGRGGRDGVVTGLERQLSDDRSQPPAQPVTNHRGPRGPGNGVGDTNRFGRVPANRGDHD